MADLRRFGEKIALQSLHNHTGEVDGIKRGAKIMTGSSWVECCAGEKAKVPSDGPK